MAADIDDLETQAVIVEGDHVERVARELVARD
jgi:hypothetical protein